MDELFAEKIRAMGQRGRPRDLYDIVNLFRRDDFRTRAADLRATLEEKCRFKAVPVPTADSVLAGERRVELETEWVNMLGHQLPVLPPLEGFVSELPALFDWLEGRSVPAALPAIPSRERVAPTWAPPPTAWTFGGGRRLESIRFAAINHLCVDLGYGGKHRLIEPYSLRRTQEGNLLLMALHADDRAVRSYRVDRIQSIRVTNRPFTPRYAVEFAAAGAPAAPPLERPAGRRRTPSAGPVFVVECSRCGKKFRRKRRDTSLRPHKDPSGYQCRGSRGYVVDTQY